MSDAGGQQKLVHAWYSGRRWPLLLLPLSWIFRLLARFRKTVHSSAADALRLKSKVIVVGNITVGGTGKTPLLINLVKQFRQQGYKVAVVSRGYGAGSATFPALVPEDGSATEYGDEPVLIAAHTGVPVVIDPDRLRALQFVQSEFNPEVVFSDDGLQHYRMPRHLEIVVVDGSRGFGNGHCLPAGPLREPLARLNEVDFVIQNGGEELAELSGYPHFVVEAQPVFLVNLVSGEKRPFSGAPFRMGSRIEAVCGIGNPDRFFRMVEKLPYPVQRRPYPDHHSYEAVDFSKAESGVSIVMTEKDAVKCRDFARDNMWYLQVEMDIPDEFIAAISAKCEEIRV